VPVELVVAGVSIGASVVLGLIGVVYRLSAQRVGRLESLVRTESKRYNSEQKMHLNTHKQLVDEKLCAARIGGIRAEIQGLSEKLDMVQQTTSKILSLLNGGRR